jgi:O-antigen/teichoic acid export membrane protein
MYEIAKRPNSREILGRVLTYFAFALIFAGLLVSVPIKEILRIMAAPPFYGAYAVVPLIAFAYVMSGINVVFQAGLFIKNETKWIGLITFSAAIVNLICNYYFISNMGIMGAALSTFVSFLFMAGGTFYFSYKVYPIEVEYLRIAKLIGLALLVFAVSRYVEFDSIIPSLVFKTSLIVVFLFALFLAKFLNEAEKNKFNSFRKLVFGRVI